MTTDYLMKDELTEVEYETQEMETEGKKHLVTMEMAYAYGLPALPVQ